MGAGRGSEVGAAPADGVRPSGPGPGSGPGLSLKAAGRQPGSRSRQGLTLAGPSELHAAQPGPAPPASCASRLLSGRP